LASNCSASMSRSSIGHILRLRSFIATDERSQADVTGEEAAAPRGFLRVLRSCSMRSCHSAVVRGGMLVTRSCPVSIWTEAVRIDGERREARGYSSRRNTR
jgi:hypothetical protein